MVERGEQDEVLVEEREFGQAGDAERGGEQQQVQAPGEQALDQGGGLLLVDLEFQLRVGGADQAQDGRQQVGRDGGDDAEADGAGEGGADRLGLLQQRADLGEDGLGARGEAFSGGGEEDPAGGPLQQGDAEDLLQGGDGAGERGLAHPEGGGRVPEVQVLGDGGEGPELGEGGSLGGAAGAGRGGAVVHGAQGLRPVLRCDEGGVGDPARRCSSLRARVGGAPVTPATS